MTRRNADSGISTPIFPPENLEERKKVCKFASRNDKQKGLHREIKKQQERDS
jgi:hypothetical protein